MFVYIRVCARVFVHVFLRVRTSCQGLFFSDIGGLYACGSRGGGVTGLAGCLKV